MSSDPIVTSTVVALDLCVRERAVHAFSRPLVHELGLCQPMLDFKLLVGRHERVGPEQLDRCRGSLDVRDSDAASCRWSDLDAVSVRTVCTLWGTAAKGADEAA